jgi:WD40 repeat protein
VSTGDTIGLKPDGVTPYRFGGIPDGIGVYDNNDGTITVVVNHELGSTSGVARAHGGIGAYVEKLVIDKATLAVNSGQDLDQQVYLWNTTTHAYDLTSNVAFNRFCSGDLAAPSAFFNAATGLGTADRIYLNGEEAGAEGRAIAHVLTGADAGKAFELSALGNLSYENAVAIAYSGDKTIVFETDDSTPGNAYFYIGDKQATGSAIDKAGLTNGNLYGIVVDGLSVENAGTTIPGGQAHFSLASLGDVRDMTGAQLQTASNSAGATQFFRPEDAAWDPTHANRLYFVTTASINDPSRLYSVDFSDLSNPTAGGTITLLLDGSEGQKMLDNLTVDNSGHVILQEDVGNNPRLGKVWDYDHAADKLTEIAQHDPARFAAPTAPFTQDEESSGVIDVSSILGDADTKAYLLDVQAHYNIGDPELVEGGQLLAMYVDTPVTIGDAGDNHLFGSAADETFTGYAGNDEILAVRATIRPMAAGATTCSTAARAMTAWPAARATTISPAETATTSWSAARARTFWPAARATIRSRAEPAPTAFRAGPARTTSPAA